VSPDTLLAVAIGVGLSAAAGFRVFVPLLAASIAGLFGHLPLTPAFDWLGTWPALVAFATATLVEVAAYKVPWLDNLLDAIASPAAVVAGILLTASVLVDVPPLVRWGLAVIAGGGAAATVQAGTVLLRSASSASTGGVGNPLVALLELVLAVLTAVLALLLPWLALGFLLVIGVAVARRLRRRATP
jgi:hypothetical protein